MLKYQLLGIDSDENTLLTGLSTRVCVCIIPFSFIKFLVINEVLFLEGGGGRQVERP